MPQWGRRTLVISAVVVLVASLWLWSESRRTFCDRYLDSIGGYYEVGVDRVGPHNLSAEELGRLQHKNPEVYCQYPPATN